MLSIKIPEDKTKIKILFEEKNFLYTENSSAVIAAQKDDVLGYCLFNLFEKGIEVLFLCPVDDIMLADGILRSALHVAAEHSAMDAHYTDSMDEKLLDKLNFIKDKVTKSLDIDKLFKGCQSCGQSK